jgi:photosystem II stability/assembly factor-like uncharacterized protein
MKFSSRALASLCCSAALAALAAPALANGRPPATVDVRPRSGGTEMVAGTTFGLTVSSNEGGSWQWVCEDAVGYGGTFDPDYEWSPTSGKLFATSFAGLRTTMDRCAFELDTGLAGRYVAAIAFGSDGALYAAANDETSLIYRSTDDGKTFPRVSQANPPFKKYDSWLSIEVAPSDPARVYLAGIRVAAGKPTEFLLYRSTDAATNFSILPLPTFTPTAMSNIELAGVSYSNANVLFVRVTNVAGGGDAIFRSADGGTTWSATPVLAKPDSLRAFVVRRSGKVYAGTPTLGSFESTDGIAFTAVAGAPHLNCVSERADGVLFGCTQNYGTPNDGAGVMKSTDGVVWSSLMRYQDIAAPQSCAAGTTQKDSCEVEVWCGIREQLGIASTVINCPLIVPDGMPDAGQPPSSSGGCCETNQTPPSLLLCGLTVVLLAWRKRRPCRKFSA